MKFKQYVSLYDWLRPSGFTTSRECGALSKIYVHCIYPVLDRAYLSRNVLAFVKMCVLCAFTLVLLYMYVTDGNARGNGKFDGRYFLVPCPFSHIYIAYMPLCVLYGAFHREISRLSSAILGFLLV